MGETHKGNVQFVGRGDARSSKFSEATRKKEFVVTPEQQRVVDAMRISGAKLENRILDARDKAANQLKSLSSKELVDAGLKQMGHGVLETVKSQVKWAFGLGALGGIGGGVAGYAASRLVHEDPIASGRILNSAIGAQDTFRRAGFNMPESALRGEFGPLFGVGGAALGGIMGVELGQFIGWETAGFKWNKKVAPKKDLPPTKWYDWVVSNVGRFGFTSLLRGRNIGRAGSVLSFAVTEMINPISVGGMRNIATGLWQMRKG